MRNLVYTVVLFVAFLTACTASSLGSLKMAEPVQENKGPVSPIKVESTSLPVKTAATASPAPAFTPVSAIIDKKVGCSSLALERSLVLTRWERGVMGHALVPYDPEQGAPLCNYKPIAVGKNNYAIISPDGNLLAFSMTQQDDFHDGRLHLVDLKTWSDLPTSIELDSWIAAMAFSSDSRYLAIAVGMPNENLGWPKHYSLVLVDVHGRVIRSQTTLEMSTRLLSFSPDGRALMLYGVRNQDSSGLNGEAHALLLDANDLELQWDLKLDGVVEGQTRLYTSDNTETFEWWGPAAMLSLERQQLFVVHANADQLTIVDFTRRDARTIDIHPKIGWIERLLSFFAGVAQAKEAQGTIKQAVLSPDSNRLYVVGRTTEPFVDSNNQTQFKTTFLGLQVIDTASGTQIVHLDTEASDLAISQDGKRLFLHGWNDLLEWTEILDTGSLEIKQHITGRTIRPLTRLDREALLASLTNRNGAQSALALFDPETLAQITVWPVWGNAGLLVP